VSFFIEMHPAFLRHNGLRSEKLAAGRIF